MSSARRKEPRPTLGRLAATFVAALSVARSLPLIVSRRPKTPLRVLCIMAFDTVHVLRHSRRLSASAVGTLATLLDFGACANDFFDDTRFSSEEYVATRRLLAQSPVGAAIDEYWRRLRDLEARRPKPGGDARQHRQAQAYRESVVRLSLGVLAAATLGNVTLDDAIQATYRDADLETLFRLVMLCQIIDDCFDVAHDLNRGLPSFLTAHASRSRALALTSAAAAHYADRASLLPSPGAFPFRLALNGVAMLTKIVLSAGQWRLKLHAAEDREAVAPA